MMLFAKIEMPQAQRKLLAIAALLSVIDLVALQSMELAKDIPGCDYFDTVDLSTSQKFSNGSYLYEGIVIPADLVGIYDYEILFNGERLTVHSHVRGCACKLKSCIRFCCHPQQLLVTNARECKNELQQQLEYDPYVNITLSDNSVEVRHVLEDFVMQRGLPVPCHFHYPLLPDHYAEDEWQLYENGTMNVLQSNESLSKRDYCMQPFKFNNTYSLLAHRCAIEAPIPWHKEVIVYVTIASIIFIILTIIVYLSLPQLRNLHGMCIVSYLSSLAVGYTMLILELTRLSNGILCRPAGYLGYFAIMAAFFWLTVISLYLWKTFNCISYNSKSMTTFRTYSIYAWGSALILTSIVIIADELATDETDLIWLPGVGYYSCWVKTQDWSAMIFFYGPMLVLIIFNLIMFILTSVRIYKIKRELKNVSARQQRKQRLKSDKQSYSFFLRLFVIMGVSWLLEIFSYLSVNNKTLEHIFLFADFLNCAQGVIIFFTFIMKRSIWKLIIDRTESYRLQSLSHNRHGNSSLRSLSSSQRFHRVPLCINNRYQSKSFEDSYINKKKPKTLMEEQTT